METVGSTGGWAVAWVIGWIAVSLGGWMAGVFVHPVTWRRFVASSLVTCGCGNQRPAGTRISSARTPSATTPIPGGKWRHSGRFMWPWTRFTARRRRARNGIRTPSGASVMPSLPTSKNASANGSGNNMATDALSPSGMNAFPNVPQFLLGNAAARSGIWHISEIGEAMRIVRNRTKISIRSGFRPVRLPPPFQLAVGNLVAERLSPLP